VDKARRCSADWSHFQSGANPSRALLDVFLQFLVVRNRSRHVHMFSTAFYQQLLEGGWTRVASWTSRQRQEVPVGIFARDLLVVPIWHEARLSALALVYRPWALAVGVSGSCPVATPSIVVVEPTLLTVADGASLPRASPHKVLRTLRDYLSEEWVSCFSGGSIARRFNSSRLSVSLVDVPCAVSDVQNSMWALTVTEHVIQQSFESGSLAERTSLTLLECRQSRERWCSRGSRIFAAAAAKGKQAPRVALRPFSRQRRTQALETPESALQHKFRALAWRRLRRSQSPGAGDMRGSWKRRRGVCKENSWMKASPQFSAPVQSCPVASQAGQQCHRGLTCEL